MLLSAAAAAAGDQQYPAPALYVVATPIGNLADVTLRALHVLGLVDAIACEDTRHTAALLGHLGISGKPLVAVPAHNEREGAAAVVGRLLDGERVAYASDAGTPGVSDPGARLVATVRDAGHRVVPIPGVSSATAAFSVAGDVLAEGFRFRGFLPSRGAQRQRAVEAALASADAQVLFEAPHRVATLLAAVAAADPTRTLTVARELTKQFESITTLRAGDATAWLEADSNRSRGEFVVVVHAQAAGDADGLRTEASRTLELLLAELPLKQAVSLAAAISGAPRNALYQEALRRRPSGDDAAAAEALQRRDPVEMPPE